MEREHVDTLARRGSTQHSRRAALATRLGAAVLGRVPPPLLAKGKHRGQVNAQCKAKAQGTTCDPGANCTPGRGKNASGCDCSFSTLCRNQGRAGRQPER
jgi:hypothetical protein